MVSGALIQEKINYGLGIAGTKLGFPYAWYRPGAPGVVVQAANQRGTITAHITPTPSLVPGPVAQGRPDVYAAFDPTDVLPGDYLVGQGATYFIGSYLPLAGVSHLFTCNETCTQARRGSKTVGPANYGGANQGNVVLAQGFPGWIKSGDRRQPSNMHLPGEVNMPTVTILLPVSFADQIIRGDQIITADTIASRWEVQSADLSPNGWSLICIKRGGVVPSDTVTAA
jgi:hypothetical protein